jgi:hypothetical protein
MAVGCENRRRTPLASRRAISWLRCSAERSVGSSGRIKQCTSQVGIARGRSVCERVCHNRLGHGKLHSPTFDYHPDLSVLSGRIAFLCGSRMRAGSVQRVGKFVRGSPWTARNNRLGARTAGVQRICLGSLICAICTRLTLFVRLLPTSIAIGRSRVPGVLTWPLTR